jgi:HK97 family phage portal protein
MMSASGVPVSPELAMTLSAVYCAVTTIGYDLATLPCQTFRYRSDDGKDRIRPSASSLETGGIGALAYLLRWQPNNWQTATEFFVSQASQFLLRSVAYAEIVPGPNGAIGQLLPRHPDRVKPERLPSGRVRYRLMEFGAAPRYLTQDEMFVVRDLAGDGLNPTSRVQYAANTIGSALAADRAAAKFFKSGMTASLVATYKGDKDDEDEAVLHQSISRYAAGVENTLGVMLIPDDVTITNLGIEPEKAQMMLAREWGVREIARFFRMPGSKLGIKDAVGYNSQVQSSLDYVITCLRPIAIAFEQAIQRDLILAKDQYFTEFKLEALLRGDPDAQATFLEKMIRNRIMRPSEARLILNMNPDPELDALSASDFQPGKSGGQSSGDKAQAAARHADQLARFQEMAATHARRCVRRERVAVEKIARRHASDPDGWQAELREFYTDHAQFVAETLALPIVLARGYAAEHGAAFEAKGIAIIAGDAGAEWEADEAEELAELAISGGRLAA